MVCVLSGGQVRGLCRELEELWAVRVLAPMWGTALPCGSEIVVVTESAVTGSFGAADACRKLLMNATCRCIPVVFTLTPGAEREECHEVCSMVGFAQGLVCRRSEAVRILDAPWEGTDMALRRRYGLQYVRILPPGVPGMNVWCQLADMCRRLTGEESDNAKTCGSV